MLFLNSGLMISLFCAPQPDHVLWLDLSTWPYCMQKEGAWTWAQWFHILPLHDGQIVRSVSTHGGSVHTEGDAQYLPDNSCGSAQLQRSHATSHGWGGEVATGVQLAQQCSNQGGELSMTHVDWASLHLLVRPFPGLFWSPTPTPEAAFQYSRSWPVNGVDGQMLLRPWWYSQCCMANIHLNRRKGTHCSGS